MALINNYYFKSKDIKVFPSSFRGTYTKDGKEVSFDPEARLNSEFNFVSAKRTSDKTSYIIEYSDTVIKFIVGGYYFELNNLSDYKSALSDQTIGITLRHIDLTTDINIDGERGTTVLGSWEGTENILDTTLENTDGTDGTSYFTGLKVLTGEETKTLKDSIKLFDADGNINQEAILVKLDHGTGENTLMHGDGLKAGTANQTVFGTYNNNKTDTLFEVGNGTNTTNSNALEISTTTTTINTATNINGDTTITGSTKIDGTTEITNNTEVKGDLIISNDTDSESTTTGALKVTGGVGISKNLNVGGDTNLNSKLIVKTSPANTETNVKIDGTLNVTGKTDIYNNVTVESEKTTLARPVEITDASDTALTVKGKTTIEKDLEVGSDTKVLAVKNSPNTGEQNVTVTGTLKSTNNVTFEKNLNVSGETTLGGQVNITGAVNINTSNQDDPKNITIYGDTTINGAVNIDGKATSTYTNYTDEDTATLTTKAYVDTQYTTLDTKINNLDFTASSDETIADDGTGSYIQSVTQTNGKVTTTKCSFETTLNETTDNNAPTSKAVDSHITKKINELDAGPFGAPGTYLQKISEADGKIIATVQPFDKSIDSSSTALNAPTSSAVKSYVDSKLAITSHIQAIGVSSEEYDSSSKQIFAWSNYGDTDKKGVTDSTLTWNSCPAVIEKDISWNGVPCKAAKLPKTADKANWYWFGSTIFPISVNTIKDEENKITTSEGVFGLGIWIRFLDNNGGLIDWHTDDSAIRIDLNKLIQNRLKLENYTDITINDADIKILSCTFSPIELKTDGYINEQASLWAEPFGNNTHYLYIQSSYNDDKMLGWQVSVTVSAKLAAVEPETKTA